MSVIIPGKFFVLQRLTSPCPPFLSTDLCLAVTVVAWSLSLTRRVMILTHFTYLASKSGVILSCVVLGQTDSSPWPVRNSYLHTHILKKPDI